MCKIKFVEVSQIMEDGVPVGMKYLDNWMVVTGFKSVDEAFYNFKGIIDTVVTDTQSIILCREDAKRFAKSIVLTVGFLKSPLIIFTLFLAAKSVKSPLCAIASKTFIVPFVTDTTPGFLTSPITITL